MYRLSQAKKICRKENRTNLLCQMSSKNRINRSYGPVIKTPDSIRRRSASRISVNSQFSFLLDLYRLISDSKTRKPGTAKQHYACQLYCRCSDTYIYICGFSKLSVFIFSPDIDVNRIGNLGGNNPSRPAVTLSAYNKNFNKY